MANELLAAVNSDYDPTKTLLSTFSAVADANYKRKKLEIDQKESQQGRILKAAGLQLREQSLALATQRAGVAAQGQELVNSLRAQKLGEVQAALQVAQDYTGEVASATVDGKPLAVRLQSNDPTEAEAAYKVFASIRDKYRASASPIVNTDLQKMEALPQVAAKSTLAKEKELTRARESDRKLGQGDRRLDQADNVLTETVAHHVAQEGHSETRLGIGQENADTRKANSDFRISKGDTGGAKGNAAGDTLSGLTVPNLGYVPMQKIRRVLGRGLAPDATPQEVKEADILRKSLATIPSGNKDQATGSMLPRFSPKDIASWADEAAAAPISKPAMPVKDPAPAAAPTPLAPAPAVPTSSTPAPGVAPLDSDPVNKILQKYKVRPITPTSQAAPADDSGIFGATQNYLANLGVTPAPPEPIGFGGFGGFGLPKG